jgi:hypothetical protein
LPRLKNKYRNLVFLGAAIGCFGISCSKLDTPVYDQVTTFWKTPDQVAASVYAGLRNYGPTFNGGPNVFSLNEMSTDEIIVPNREGNWWDNGIWYQMWTHKWDPTHQFIVDGWGFIYNGVANINSILESLQQTNPKPSWYDSIQAELKTIRAFDYYLAVDLFGNVPIAEVGVTDLSKLGTLPRDSVFRYAERELKNNLPLLSAEVNQQTYGRVTQWFAQATLAKLYLNAQVYTGKPRWTDCIAACDAILNSGKYALEPRFFDNFLVSNEGSTENIFVIPFDIASGMDFLGIQLFTLHYNSNFTFGLQSGGANGWCSTAQYYNLFSPADLRRKMFLVGQQYVNQDSVTLQYDTQGNLLNFDPVITTFTIPEPKTEVAGARCAKWEFNKQGFGDMSNDFAVYRLADIILMKAEAQFRNGDIAGALVTMNKAINGVSIRNRVGLPDFQTSDINPDSLLNERARELSWEGWRRNDMIRLGHFLDARIPEKQNSESFRMLYPIPEVERVKNHNLIQNPGY